MSIEHSDTFTLKKTRIKKKKTLLGILGISRRHISSQFSISTVPD